MIDNTKVRTLINGRTVPALAEPVTLTIHTKCPEKWMLLDMETGERYITHKDLEAGPKQWRKVVA